MNELTINTAQLPDTLEDLASWDKFLSARLPTYRKLLHSVKSWEEATEEEQRILRRAQEESENLIDVRVRIGELTQAIPKAKENQYTKMQNDINVERQKPKSETLSEMGISQKQAERYQRLANHPEAVQKAKEEARKRNDVVSQQDVLNRIIIPTKSKQAEQKQEVNEARERQEEFKTNKTVSIQDIKQNKEDAEIIGKDLYRKLLKVGDAVDAITFTSKINDINSMVKATDKTSLNVLCSSMERSIAMLSEILTIIRR